MHVADGLLASPVLAGGWAVAGVTTAVCLRTVKEEQIPRTAVLTACFFVASTIHVPLWGTSIHLVLSGLCGVILGPAAFLAVLLGLVLQCVLFGHGGIVALGFNSCAMGLSAIGAWAWFRLWRAFPRGRAGWPLLAGALVAGSGAVLVGNGIVWAGLALSGKTLAKLAPYAFLAHVVLAAVEGVVTAGAVRFLSRVEPRLLWG